MSRFSQYILAIVLFSFFNMGCAEDRLYYTAPSILPTSFLSVDSSKSSKEIHRQKQNWQPASPAERMMKRPGFWISRHPSPDKIILNSQEILQLNSNIQNELKLTQDIIQSSAAYSGQKLRREFEGTLESFLKRKLYADHWSGFPEAFFFDEIQSNFNLDSIPAVIKPRYGLIVHYANQRFFPTNQGLYAQKKDIDFDEIQNSSLDVGIPVTVLHQSKDGQWLYTVSSSSSGWVPVQDIALCSLKELKNFNHPNFENFLVVTKSKADIFLDQKLTEYYDYARMGSEFVIQNRVNQNIVAVHLPLRKEDGRLDLSTGYIQTKDIHEGYWPYTARHTIGQAFELLNAPYGWGGMYGEQDCSAFLQEIFATIGIHLPRNSSAQAQAGKLLEQFDKNFLLKKKLELLSTEAVGGATILPLKGHIMLFLGMVDGHAYAIHATWGYREHGWLRDRVRVLNRVVVSDLSLGEGSRKGSLLHRLLSIRFLGK